MFEQPYQSYLDAILPLCAEASAVILRHYENQGDLGHETKADDSPLTQADIASHHILVEGLRPLGLPVLSEESSDQEIQARREWKQLWMVDPLDGTKEFIGRTGEFTINLALVEDTRPVMGVIAVPLSGNVYAGVPGQGAWCHDRQGWRPLATPRVKADEPLLVLTSRRHRGETLEKFLEDLGVHPGGVERRYAGSALKFCQMLDGEGDVYPRFSPCSEWDTAAGDALLVAAGGCLLGMDGMPLLYNQRDSLLNPHFVALSDPDAGRTLAGLA